jgi:hypothetical protein|nr:MAG TPA: hypothetical protein [Bacteriophage sp.]
MLNIEKYKKEVIARLDTCKMERMIYDITGFSYCGSDSDHCTPCAEYVYKWLLSEYKEPVLNDAERKYLSAVIKPFKNYVTGIAKIKDDYMIGNHYIRIIVKKDTQEYINLPWFEGNTMYKGMELNKEYTLKELGL